MPNMFHYYFWITRHLEHHFFFSLFSLFSWLYQNQDSVTCLSLQTHWAFSAAAAAENCRKSKYSTKNSADELWCCLDKTRMPQIRKTKTKEPIMIFFCPPSLFGSLHLDWYFLLFTTSCNVFLPRTPFETSIAMS